MPILSISQTLADANQDDVLLVLGNRPMPPVGEKGTIQLTYTGTNPERQAAFRRLQRLPGVIAEY